MNVVEIPAVGFLWALWFSLAILCASAAPLLFPDGCLPSFDRELVSHQYARLQVPTYDPLCFSAVSRTFCIEFFLIESLAFVAWNLRMFIFRFIVQSFIKLILLEVLAYIGIMIIICLIGKSRGHAVWLVSANTPVYFKKKYSTRSDSIDPGLIPHPVQPTTYPPQQAYVYHMKQSQMGYIENAQPTVIPGVAQV